MYHNINILPLVEGVMVDYHTREKYHSLGWYSFSREWSSNITSSTKAVCFFLLYWMPVIKKTEFLLESVNQWDALCTYHYLNKATTTIISTSNIFIMVTYNCFIIFQYYYLNIKILRFYEILEKNLKFWIFFFNFEILCNFWNLHCKLTGND